MMEIPIPDRLHRGITLSKLLVGLNLVVLGLIIWNCVLLFQGFFNIQGGIELVVEAFKGRVGLAYWLTWVSVALTAIDIMITIFSHESFHGGRLSFKAMRNSSNATQRNLIYHGIAAGANTGLLIGWIAYFAHGASLFQGEPFLGSITITPVEYLAYLMINGLFAITTGIFTFFLISTRWLTSKRFQADLLPHPILSTPEPQVPTELASTVVLNEIRVPPVGIPPSEPSYIPIEERKAQKLEELRIRRENMYETEKAKMIQELEEKKKELLAMKRKEEDKKMRRSRQYQKIKQDILLKVDEKSSLQKPAEKPAGKKKDEFDFT